MHKESKGFKVIPEPGMKTLSDIRAEDERKRMEIRTKIYDSYTYVDDLKKSDEVFIFQTNLNL